MANQQKTMLTRIGVFYDGNYFLHVSNYYNYIHDRKSRISISGLHSFVRNEIAVEEGADLKMCQIVDAHYFRGRLSAGEASQRGNLLYYDRVFDDILMAEGVTTHYYPIKSHHSGIKQEKGVDVSLALEAFELAFYKRFDVVVLIACDGDYVPLIRKLNSLGTRVMVISWDFEYTNDAGQKMTTRTSQDLLEDVTYPLAMHEIIDNRLRRNDPLINNLFVPISKEKMAPRYDEPESGARITSTILTIKNGYGFIKYAPTNNLFFHHESLIDIDFNELHEGDTVEFSIRKNEKGETLASDICLVDETVMGSDVNGNL